MREEVGLECEIGRIINATTLKTSATRQVIILAYVCHSQTVDIILSKEHMNYHWITKEEIYYLDENILLDFFKNYVLQIEEWDVSYN